MPAVARKNYLKDPALIAMGILPGGPEAEPYASQAVRWRAAWIAIIAGFIGIVGLFWHTAAQIVDIWSTSSTFNHGFLIPPICMYLVWIKRKRIAEMLPQPTYWGLAVIFAGGFFWLLGHLASVAMVKQFSLIIMLQGTLLTVFGWKLAALLAFPLFYMYFAVPFGEFLIAPLQDLTALFVVKALRLVDIPVFLDGLFIAIPTGNFEVAEACSGVRFLIATVALGFLFAHLTYKSLWRQVLFIALAAIVPIIANGFRAFGIVLIAYYTNNEFAVGVDHIVYGWIFFAFVTVVLLFLGMTFREDLDDDDLGEVNLSARDAASAGIGVRPVFAALGLSLIVSSLAPVYALYIAGRPVPALAQSIPAPKATGWAFASNQQMRWTPLYPGHDLTVKQRYRSSESIVDLYVAYFASQRGGGELVSVRNVLADGKRWNRASTNITTVEVDGAKIPVVRHRVFGPYERRVVYQWFWIGGQFTANPYLAKLLQARQELFGGQETAAAITISAPYLEVPADADRALVRWLSSAEKLRPILQRAGSPR